MVTLDLDILPTHLTALKSEICQGESLLFQGEYLTTQGTYSANLQNTFGCDSIVVLELGVLPTHLTSLSDSICEGEVYFFEGVGISQPGSYSVTWSNMYGCDSTITLDLDVMPSAVTFDLVTICQGDTVFFDGKNLTAAGNYTGIFSDQMGCDSFATLSVEVLPSSLTNLQEKLCAGDRYIFHGDTITKSGAYSVLLQNAAGCDSLVKLQLEVLPTFQTNLTQQICQGQSFAFGGNVLSTPGIYTSNLKSAAGCDSVSSIRPHCWRRPSKSPRAAASRWTNCVTSIRTRSSRPAKRRPAGCDG